VKGDSSHWLSLNDAGMRPHDLVLGVTVLDQALDGSRTGLGARCSFDASLLEAHTRRPHFWLAGVGNL
jgi:hypothetical protein